jgi:hypothetical protein
MAWPVPPDARPPLSEFARSGTRGDVPRGFARKEFGPEASPELSRAPYVIAAWKVAFQERRGRDELSLSEPAAR